MEFKFFPAFFDHPAKMRFSQQEPDEIIELLLRQHFIVNIPWIFYSILAMLLPFLIYNLKDLLGLSFINSAPVNLQLAVLTLWYLIILAYVLESFLSWYFNIYIVTNRHVIDVDLTSLLSRQVREANIIDVQSAVSQIRGLIASFFNYGDVFVETAAKDATIIFANVPYPDIVVDRVNDLKEQPVN